MEPPAKVPTEVREIFRQYVGDKRDLIDVSGKFYLKGWPDRKDAIAMMVAAGHLNCDIELVRFEYLTDRRLVTREACQSLSGIEDRIFKEWTTTDENALAESSTRYRQILAELGSERFNLQRMDLAGPGDDASRDPEYLRAVEENHRKYWALDARLKELSAEPQEK